MLILLVGAVAVLTGGVGFAVFQVTGGGGGAGAAAPGTASPGPQATPASPGSYSPRITDGRFVGQGVIVPVPNGWDVDRANLPAGLVIVRPGDIIEQQRILAADDTQTSRYVNLDGDTLEENVRQIRAAFEQKPALDRPLPNFKNAVAAHQLVFRGVRQSVPGTPTAGPPLTQMSIVAEGRDGQFALFIYTAPRGDFQRSVADRLRNQAGLHPGSEPSRR